MINSNGKGTHLRSGVQNDTAEVLSACISGVYVPSKGRAVAVEQSASHDPEGTDADDKQYSPDNQRG